MKNHAIKTALLVLTFCFHAVLSFGKKSDEARLVQSLGDSLEPLANLELLLSEAALERIAQLIGDARIVGLGEATHGTIEETLIRRQIVEHLVTHHGFSLFAIEDQVAEATLVNEALGNPNERADFALEKLNFWPWQNKELGRLLAWMQTEIAIGGPDRIQFHGFDTQNPYKAIELLGPTLKEHRPDLLPLYQQAAEATGGNPHSFGYAVKSFPAKHLHDKILRASVKGRLENSPEGNASLRLRAKGKANDMLRQSYPDAPIREQPGWTTQTVELEVPVDAETVDLMLVLSGRGTAYFDELSLQTIDGELIERLDVEEAEPEEFRSHGSDIEMRIGDQDSRGIRSLLLASTSRPPNEKLDAKALWSELQTKLENEGSDKIQRFVAVALEHARTRARATDREAGMAEMISMLAQQNPDKKLILWAHNVHLATNNLPRSKTRAMGSHLREEFGRHYFVIGLAVGSGTYLAINQTERRLMPNPLPEPLAGSIERALLDSAPELAIARFDQLPRKVSRQKWLHRLPGSVANDKQFLEVSLFTDYDALIWIPRVRASEPIDFQAGD